MKNKQSTERSERVAHLNFCLFALLEFLEVTEYPEHIKRLVEKEKELEEQEKRQREIERNTCKVCSDMFHLNRICAFTIEFVVGLCIDPMEINQDSVPN